MLFEMKIEFRKKGRIRKAILVVSKRYGDFRDVRVTLRASCTYSLCWDAKRCGINDRHGDWAMLRSHYPDLYKNLINRLSVWDLV